MSTKSIVIVDDAKLMRLMLKSIVEKAGYKVLAEMENASQLLEQYTELAPDLVLLDVIMPKMSGLEALEALFEMDENAKVIMVSSAGKESNINKAQELGAKNFITKPFDENKIVEIINQVLMT